uniref:Ubiquitin carboxyl-terminal hydrolase 47 n=1 Tax=Peronospora matthiolae TaxID=2874970 RepID=A0AAV1US23_9STRA
MSDLPQSCAGPHASSTEADGAAAEKQRRAHVLSVLKQLPRVAVEKELPELSASPSTSDVPSTALTTVAESGGGRIGDVEKPLTMDCGRSASAFTGLSNQGATCYMNSLLQSMFMTPEFRQGLYRWTCCNVEEKVLELGDEEEEEEGEEADEDNIPLQLQNLFAKLQLTTQDAISTKALTKSFGWTGADVFQQHDVQELCRVLLDALERSFKDTVNENLVNELFEGALKDYVQCRECGYESSRIDTFLDLSLVIRPFGSMDMMKTVEEAIEFFLRPEVLDKENQWMCDQCKVKRDAIKGLKFSKLPYILMLQLKRFDFDYATMNRIKLHNKVTFPKYLDMNSYMSDEHGGARGKIARKMSMERHVLETNNHHKLNEGLTATLSSPPVTPLCASLGEKVHRLSSMDESQPIEFENEVEEMTDDNEDDDMYGSSSPDTWSPAFDPETMIKRFGPHVYELYSVLIHSGSALGGHYYAYIKSLETGKWYNFNDANVSEISDAELKTAFGGATGTGYSARYSTCAYMLLYRLVSAEKNVRVIPPDNIPQFLKDRIRADEDRIRRLEQERLEMSKKMLVKLYMKGSKPKNIEKAIYLYKSLTIREALEIAREEFAEDDNVIVPSTRNVRLRGYNDYNCLLSDTYSGREDMTLSSLGFYAGQQMFLEVKSDIEEWEEHDPTKLQLFIRRFIDEESGTVSKPPPDSLMVRCVQVKDDADIASLCALIANKFSVPANHKIRLIKKSATTYSIAAAKVLNADDEKRTLNLRLKMDLHLVNGTELYFEETPELSMASPAEAFFEREANMITVNFKYLARPAQPIRIDRRSTIRALKESISREIGLPSDAFKLLRGINSAGVEIKAIDSTLSKLSIGSNHTVFALEGTPLNTGEYNFRLIFHNPVHADRTFTESNGIRSQEQFTETRPSVDCSNSEGLFNIDEVLVVTAKDDSVLTFVNHIVICEEMPIEDIRKKVWDELVGKGFVNADDEHLTPSHIRLRDLRQNTMTNILVDGQKLVEASKLAVYEGRSIVAEILTEPETREVNHRVVEFAYVDRATWRFVDKLRSEVVISTFEEVDHPETYLAEAASIALSIPAERLRFARIPYHRDSVDIIEVVTYNYLPAASFARTVNEYQELFLVIDIDVKMTYMGSHERQLIHRFLTKRSEEKTQALCAKYPSSGNSTYQYQKPKEAALVIRTRSRTSEHKDTGSVGSSNGKTSNGVSIRTPTHRAGKTASRNHASSDTDDEDDTDFIAEKTEALDVDLFGGLS